MLANHSPTFGRRVCAGIALGLLAWIPTGEVRGAGRMENPPATVGLAGAALPVPGAWPLPGVLRASGVREPAALARYTHQVAGWADELRALPAWRGDDRQRATAVLAWLHRCVLVGRYRADCNDVVVALERGDYNCLTSTVLYVELARRCGLDAVGLEAPGHVLCRVRSPRGNLDVETTCAEWLAAGQAALPAPQHEAAALRELPAEGLAALVHYNRGIELLGQGRYAEALAANQQALALDPRSAAARCNLLATMNNWALELNRRGEQAQALRLLREGRRIAPDYATIRSNLAAIEQRLTTTAGDRGSLAPATVN